MPQPNLPGTLPSPKLARDEFVRAWKEVRERRADVERFKEAVKANREICEGLTQEWEEAAELFSAENTPAALDGLLRARAALESSTVNLKGALGAHLNAGKALASAVRLLDAADRALSEVAAGLRGN